MSAIDIAFLLIFIAAAFFGFTKGAVRQIGSFAGVLAGWIGARAVGARVGLSLFAPQPGESSWSEHMAEVMGSVIVFVCVFIAVFIVARLLRHLITIVGLGIIDSLGGALISVVKWFVAVSIVLNIWLFVSPDSQWLKGSTLAGGKLFRGVVDLFPALMGLCGLN